MNEINLYSEMNEKIADLLLGCGDNPMYMYAGAYIKDLERRLQDCAPGREQSLGVIDKYCSEIAGEAKGIERDERVMGGMPVIKNTRIPVSLILTCLKDGMAFEEIRKEYCLMRGDIENALGYAAKVLDAPYG